MLTCMKINSTKKELLDAASLLVQTRGYNGFSFHDLGAAVGITTASIHYHFPTKAYLGQQLVKRYTAEFMAALGDPEASPPHKVCATMSACFGPHSQRGACAFVE